MAKVLVSMDDQLLQRVDERARDRGLTRSAYLAQLAERDLPARAPSKEARARVREGRRFLAEQPRAEMTDSTLLVRQMRDTR